MAKSSLPASDGSISSPISFMIIFLSSESCFSIELMSSTFLEPCGISPKICMPSGICVLYMRVIALCASSIIFSKEYPFSNLLSSFISSDSFVFLIKSIIMCSKACALALSDVFVLLYSAIWSSSSFKSPYKPLSVITVCMWSIIVA